MPYFLVKNQKIIDEYNKYQESYKNMRTKAHTLVNELKGSRYFLRHCSLIGIEFKERPSKDWVPYSKKRYSNLYRPHRGTIKGKELRQKFKDVGRVDRAGLDKVSGFGRGIFIGNTLYAGPALELGINDELIMIISEAVCLHQEFNLPEGLDEITLSEYVKIRKEKK